MATVEEYIHDYDIDPKSRTIFLFGREEHIVGLGTDELTVEPGVDYSLANRFIRNLHILSSKPDPITIQMKTCGGLWEEGISIYDSIKSCKQHVTIINHTHARSMSSLILQAANWRIMMPHSIFMIHKGTFEFGGTVTSAESEFTQLQRQSKEMLEIYANSMAGGKHGKKSTAWRSKWCEEKMKQHEDYYMTAQEAVDLGFADEVLKPKKDI